MELAQIQSVDDLLSELPSEILVSILEKLDLRDCIRAGALSRRWRRLPHRLPRLVLDIRDFLGDGDECYEEDDDEEGGDEEEEEAPADGPLDRLLAGASDRMLEAATALLASRAAAGEPVYTLAMRFLLRRKGNHHMSLGRLLDDAVASGGVRAVELTVSTTGSDDDDDVDGQVEHGRRFRALFDGCPAAFGGLTRLALKKMELDRRNFRDILTTCTRLESWSLSECDAGPGRLWHVRHQRLVELTIKLCSFRGVDLAWVPKLERVVYRHWDTEMHPPLSFGHVPRLTAVAMSNVITVCRQPFRLSQILANTAISDLDLNFWGKTWVKPEAPKKFIDMFRNLKHLRIRNVHEDCGLSWTYFLLQAAPALKELYIELCNHECQRELFPVKKSNVSWEVADGFKHYSLTQLTILGFYSTGDRVVAYIRRVVEASVNMKEIEIREDYPCKKCGLASRMGFPRTAKEKSALRERISSSGSVAVNIVCNQF
ncbi:hypothetical protein ACP70R_003609 [Stipagrostis hirtigluma subsp. patula]